MRFMMIMLPNVPEPDWHPSPEGIAAMSKAKSKQEAVQWASRCPANDGDVIEVRQVYEMTDYETDGGGDAP